MTEPSGGGWRMNSPEEREIEHEALIAGLHQKIREQAAEIETLKAHRTAIVSTVMTDRLDQGGPLAELLGRMGYSITRSHREWHINRIPPEPHV